MKLGEKIRGIRTLKGLSQENMAEMLEMSLRGYGDIERGTTDVPFSRLEQIAEKLGVQTTDILTYGDRVSNFFDNCSNPQINTGINNKSHTFTNNYDQRELQHQNDKLRLEIKLLQTEKEKIELEMRFLKERYEEKK